MIWYVGLCIYGWITIDARPQEHRNRFVEALGYIYTTAGQTSITWWYRAFFDWQNVASESDDDSVSTTSSIELILDPPPPITPAMNKIKQGRGLTHSFCTQVSPDLLNSFLQVNSKLVHLYDDFSPVLDGWNCTVSCGDATGTGTGTDKKAAKKDALEMICRRLGWHVCEFLPS